MKLGLYYHVPALLRDGKFYIESYFGLFVLDMAEQCRELYFFVHESAEHTENMVVLEHPKLKVVSLGKAPTFYKRMLSPGTFTKVIAAHSSSLDAFLVRAPTPLAPFIYFSFNKHLPVYYLLVGSYITGLKALEQPLVRKIGIHLFIYLYQLLQNYTLRNSPVFVNSGALKEQYKNIASEVHLVKTTTLLPSSFFKREDTCQNKTIKLLYTGRINYQKGLRELVEAAALLIHSDKINCEVHIVGWQERGVFDYEHELKQLAAKLNIGPALFFHGKKAAGDELNAFYRNCDLYVIPSYHEGFPRTIWEAMANSLPVVASNVGGIPYYVEDRKEVLLVEPKNVQSLHEALKTMILNQALRQELIRNAYVLSNEVTSEKQCKNMVDIITSLTHARATRFTNT